MFFCIVCPQKDMQLTTRMSFDLTSKCLLSLVQLSMPKKRKVIEDYLKLISSCITVLQGI